MGSLLNNKTNKMKESYNIFLLDVTFLIILTIINFFSVKTTIKINLNHAQYIPLFKVLLISGLVAWNLYKCTYNEVLFVQQLIISMNNILKDCL